MINLIYLIIFCILFMISCENTNDKDDLKLSMAAKTELENNIHPAYPSNITEFAILHNMLIYTTSSPVHSVTGYDMESGEQVFFREVYGSGPYELDGLFTLTRDNEYFYLLDYSGKIIALNKHGEPVSEIITELTRGQSFIPLDNENFIVASNSQETESYLQLINKEHNTIENFELEQQAENIIMQTIREAGVLTKYNESLMVTPPYSEGVLYQIHNPDGNPEVTEIDPAIPGFESKSLEDPLQAYFEQPDRVEEYAKANSAITGLHRFEDQWLLEVLHMHNDYRIELHLLNNDMEIRCSTEIDDHIDFADNDHIYFYNLEDIQEQDLRMSFNKYNVSCQ